jgi:hypothetical protein
MPELGRIFFGDAGNSGVLGGALGRRVCFQKFAGTLGFRLGDGTDNGAGKIDAGGAGAGRFQTTGMTSVERKRGAQGAFADLAGCAAGCARRGVNVDGERLAPAAGEHKDGGLVRAT